MLRYIDGGGCEPFHLVWTFEASDIESYEAKASADRSMS